MTSSVQQAVLNSFATHATASGTVLPLDTCKALYEENRHKIYSIAFWMTDNEITAEDISSTVFTRTFSRDAASPEAFIANLDTNLIASLRELMPIGMLTLNTPITASTRVFGNTKRVHLERAVIALPPTERLAFLLHDVESYDHSRIARMLGITEEESQSAVCEARVMIRELVSQML